MKLPWMAILIMIIIIIAASVANAATTPGATSASGSPSPSIDGDGTSSMDGAPTSTTASAITADGDGSAVEFQNATDSSSGGDGGSITPVIVTSSSSSKKNKTSNAASSSGGTNSTVISSSSSSKKNKTSNAASSSGGTNSTVISSSGTASGGKNKTSTSSGSSSKKNKTSSSSSSSSGGAAIGNQTASVPLPPLICSRGSYLTAKEECTPCAPGMTTLYSGASSPLNCTVNLSVLPCAVVNIKLGMDISEVDTDEQAFEQAFIGEVAAALQVPQDRIRVDSIVAGSIIVETTIYGAPAQWAEPTASSLATMLQQQAADSTSRLHQGTYTQHVLDASIIRSESSDVSSGRDYASLVAAGMIGAGTVAVLVALLLLAAFAVYRHRRLKRTLPDCRTIGGEEMDDASLLQTAASIKAPDHAA